MTVRVPESLELVLQEDQRGKINAAYNAAEEQINASRAADPRFAAFQRFLETLRNANKEMMAKLDPLDEQDVSTHAAIAEILGVTLQEVVAFAELVAERKVVLEEAVNIPGLKEQWEELLPLTRIVKVTGELPIPTEKPMIVFYSADWCGPCQRTKPTFAMLSLFFDKADLYYCSDEDIREKEKVPYIPQLVAYFPSGARVSSSCGSSTQDLWDAMNKLVTLGVGFAGRGMLVCNDESCQILPGDEVYP